MEGTAGFGLVDGEEDYVIRELDVCVSRALENQLYLLQLPLKPVYIETPGIYEARMKVNSKILEVSGDETIPKLSATALNSHRGNVALGVVRNNTLHLTGAFVVVLVRSSLNMVYRSY
jgi:hypothetical protein